MRRNEVLHLQWSMVDARHRCLRLPDSKTGQRVIPISRHALAILDELRRSRRRKDVPWVIYTANATPILGPNLSKAWRRLRARAGLDDFRLHDLRHSAASDALMAGVSLEVVAKILGHSSTRMTARYAHLADHVLHDAAPVDGRQHRRGRGERGAEARRTASADGPAPVRRGSRRVSALAHSFHSTRSRSAVTRSSSSTGSRARASSPGRRRPLRRRPRVWARARRRRR